MELAKQDIKIITEALALYSKSKQRMINTCTNENIKLLLEDENNNIARVAGKIISHQLPLDEPKKK